MNKHHKSLANLLDFTAAGFKGIADDLLNYCERDSEGMVVIYRHLREVVK